MTELPSSDNKRTSLPWLLPTFGLALGVSVVMVAIVFVGLLALESPSSRRAAASAAASTAPLAAPSGSAAEPLPEQAVTAAPTATTEPSPTPTVSPTSTPAPTDTPFPTATATSTPTSTPTATRPAATRMAAKSAPAKSPTLTPAGTPLPLNMSFYVKAYCHKSTDSSQVVDMYLTAHDGVPPYDYYNDATQIGHSAGMIRFTMRASSGNPVPYKIIIIDSAGNRLLNEFFYKTGVTCKAKPE